MFTNIANSLANCFKIPELKSRIIFTVIALAICRLAALIPAPGLDAGTLTAALEKHHGGDANSLLGMYSLFTGGGFERCAIGSLGIMPYISATIILQLLTAVIPQLSKLAREEGGRSKIIQYGRVLTVLICLGQGLFAALSWENPKSVFGEDVGQLITPMYTSMIWLYRIQTTLILTTGTVLLMWIGEQITDRGIGNGVSLVIAIGILARLPAAWVGIVDMFFRDQHTFNVFQGIALILLLLGVMAGIIAITQAQRKIPVQYAQRAVGKKVYSGGSSFLPLKVLYPGVMPVIFASAILMLPGFLFKMIGAKFGLKFFTEISQQLERGSALYLIMFSLMILFFSYFWVATQFNEIQIADDMKKSGGYIPGVRPGQATSDFLHRAMSRITLAGALCLVAIAVVPMILQNFWKIPNQVAQYFGGTSMLIMVGVMLDTMRQMETHLLMRHYDGFLKKGRLKGRF